MKSPKKMTSTHARCGSSGGLLICIDMIRLRLKQLSSPTMCCVSRSKTLLNTKLTVNVVVVYGKCIHSIYRCVCGGCRS